MILLAINIIAYLCTAWILGSYFWVQRGGPVKWMNWSNFIGAIPLAIIEIIAGIWAPLVVTLAFGIIGLYGLIRRDKIVYDVEGVAPTKD